ncbi:MAG: hypothetical protein XD63_0902 [Thermoanaerobacterales bacterium 50_218]|nr:MAG: hypothetical protein XD63_0902 [Thermoanaerobacterales bacterium 50_218]
MHYVEIARNYQMVTQQPKAKGGLLVFVSIAAEAVMEAARCSRNRTLYR